MEAVYGPGVLPLIGVTQLRALYPTLDGRTVTVGLSESGVSCAGSACWQTNPEYVGQPTGIFTWIGPTGATRDYFPNDIGQQSLHANFTGAGFFGHVTSFNIYEGVAYGVAHVDNWNSQWFKVVIEWR